MGYGYAIFPTREQAEMALKLQHTNGGCLEFYNPEHKLEVELIFSEY
jgi:hypothetical protein